MNKEYLCEKCGKLVLEPYGSGRFCSRACANSKPRPKEVRDKISRSVKKTMSSMDKSKLGWVKRNKNVHAKCLSEYLANTKQCKVCGNDIPYDRRFYKTCSKACRTELNRKNGGFKEGSVKNHKYGKYKGFNCDSSWELAFLVYHLDKGYSIKRNVTPFEYVYENEVHKYYPDFIVDDTYIEIKNFKSPQVECKIRAFPKNLKYKILFYKDVKPYIDYCINKYGKKYWEVLYGSVVQG